ncbi:MAG: PcfJ domain-containing protein [Gammaproteobacteria bacterium]|nr:PcfJ domain-containing protein [Gammaproteobacteria bacterium]
MKWYEFSIHPVTLRVSGWSDGLLVESNFTGAWEQITDIGNTMLFPNEKRLISSSLQSLQQTIPELIRHTVQTFAIDQYRLLRLAALSTHAQQLCLNNPMLYWLWSRTIDLEAIETAADLDTHPLLLKQHQLFLNLLGEGAADWVKKQPKAALKVLHKVTLESGDYRELEAIYHLFSDESFYQARLFPRLYPYLEYNLLNCTISNLWRLNIRREYDELPVTEKKIYRSKSLTEIGVMIHDIRRMSALFDDGDPLKKIKRASSFKELTQLHDAVVENFNRHQHTYLKKLIFPIPPILGNQQIEPITTGYELLREGETMNHCVASYESKVMEGTSYIYRINEPERATLELGLDRSHPYISQIRGKFNATVQQATVDSIETWINNKYNE